MTKQNLAPKIFADFLKNFFVRIAENINKKNLSYKCKLQEFSNQFILFKATEHGRTQLNHKSDERK